MATGGPNKISQWVDPADKSGEFKRSISTFRERISTTEGAKYAPAKDRYHLYVSYACPWGWHFASADNHEPGDNVTPDPLHPTFTHLREMYFQAEPNYKGRFTVPVLFDKKTATIVNNESSEIIRMMYTEFDALLPEKYQKVVLLPKELERSIDEMNEWVYNDINNGVYKSGFATVQEAYEKAAKQLFHSLDRIESHLTSSVSRGPYLFGERLTEADIRLYTTIVRFDVVYVQHFKCNMRDIRSGYPALHRWLRHLYWKEDKAFRSTTNFYHIKNHYTKSHPQINPHGVTPVGPVPDILPMEEEVKAVEAAVSAVRSSK
ncbi:MAG: S-glutathionyl-(chloro)hydroquinone reductase [Phylliscum demangeonii]|nr:MAG: S-glutathionyl-(chloro)hydroquinone reductase [Phylliscum demangeonii]